MADSTTLVLPEIDYPESDGKPYDSDLHRIVMTDLIFALKWFLLDTRAYVSGDLFIYYEEGNPLASVVPDVFVVRGIDQYDRRTFLTWNEGGRVPDVVIELTSEDTREVDQKHKPLLYAQLGVPEYFVFDPYSDWLEPQLQGFRLMNGAYQPIEECPLRSDVLGLELRVDDNHLRLYNPTTGERLATPYETVLWRRAAEARTAEAENEHLRAELARLQGEQQHD